MKTICYRNVFHLLMVLSCFVKCKWRWWRSKLVLQQSFF